MAVVEVDDDTSAYSGKPRPGYRRILDGVESGSIGAVVAWHPDRLHRSPAELEDFIAAVDAAGVEVATVQSGRVDLTTPAGRLQARLLGNIARYESEHRSARTRAAHEAIAASGNWSGGKRPFGYSVERDAPGGLRIVATEAAAIRSWVDGVIAGRALGELVEQANAAGLPTVTGSAWTVPTLRGIITSDRIAAIRTHRRTASTVAGRWEPIVTPEELATVRQVLRARGGRRDPDGWRRYLLTGGIAVCGECGTPLIAARGTKGAPRYVCPAISRGGCGRVSVSAERLEDTVAEMVLVAAADAVLPPAADRPVEPVDDGAGDRLAELAAMYARGEISRGEWEAARSAAADRVNVMPTADPLAAWRSPGALEDAWPELPTATRRIIIGAVMERVEVTRATKRGAVWDPDRVHPVWRA